MTGDEMQTAIEFLLKNQANFETQIEESNRRFEMQTEETNRQIAQINHVVESLADTQTAFTQTVIGFVTSQNELNDSFQRWNDAFQKKLDALAQAQQLTEQEILELTKTVNNIIDFSSGNGNSPRE